MKSVSSFKFVTVSALTGNLSKYIRHILTAISQSAFVNNRKLI